jgi:hypothetical protein
MSQLVYSLPTWLFGVIVIGAWMLFPALGVTIARPWVEARVGDRHHDVIVPLFTTTATMYAVAVSFLVVIAWQRYADAGASETAEASVVIALYRETVSMPQPLAGHLREQLRSYTTAVIERDWPEQSRGGSSPEAQQALDRIYGDYLSRQLVQGGAPEVYQQFLGNLDRLAELRAARILSSRSSLPLVLTFGLITGGVLTITYAGLLVMQRQDLQVLAAMLMGAMIGLLLFLFFVLTHPYGGSIAVSPADFVYARSVFDAVDVGVLG